MKNSITLTNDEAYTAITALNTYKATTAISSIMDEKSKSIEAARADALIDKLKKLVQVRHD